MSDLKQFDRGNCPEIYRITGVCDALQAPPKSSFLGRMTRILTLSVRVSVPVAILGLGIYAFSLFSIPVEEEKKDEKEAKLIRTNVTDLRVCDYSVTVHANGIVQPFNEVAFSAEVAGRVTQISPCFEVGSFFSRGDLLLEIDDQDYKTALDIAEASKLGAEATLDLATQELQRLEELLKSNNVSEAEVMQASANKKQAAASLQTAAAGVEQAKRDLARTKIHAPFDGRLRSKTVGLGQSIGAGTPLGIAFSVELAEVRLPVSSRELQFLNLPEDENQPAVEIELSDAISENSPDRWKAKIVRTEGTLDVNSLELFAIARIEDPFGLKTNKPTLRVGQPVEASIPGATLHGVVALPRSAVRQLDKIYLVDNQKLTLSTKTIEAVWSDEEYVIVRDTSIADGNSLSTTSLVYAPEGAKVEIIPDIELAAAADQTEQDKKAATN